MCCRTLGKGHVCLKFCCIITRGKQSVLFFVFIDPEVCQFPRDHSVVTAVFPVENKCFCYIFSHTVRKMLVSLIETMTQRWDD